MLIRSLYGRPLTNLIKYSMMLDRKPVDAHFQSNFKLARERIQKLMTEFKMSKSQGRKFFAFYPDVFKQNSAQFKNFKHRIELINKIAAEQGKRGVIGKVLHKNLFRTNHLAFNMSDKQINDLVSTVEKYFGDDAQIEKIFHRCPNLINPKFCEIFLKKLNILTDYLQIKPEQAMKLFEASPLLIPTSERKLRESIVTLSRKYNMTKQQMMKLMSSMGEVFMLGGPNLSDTHKTPVSWGLNNSQIKQTFLNHPLLFFNYPYNVMPFKLKILKHMSFTETMAKKVMRDYPQILIWSIRSLEQKAIFIMNRLLLKVDEDTLQLLKFNFNKTLRPRGEILIRSKQIYDKTNIVSFMELSDEQFAKKVDVPLQRLQEQKAKFAITREMDFKRSKVISYVGAKSKFIKLAQAYDH